jgi:phage terminase small subunit
VTARRQTPKRSKPAAPAEGSSSTSSGRRKRQSPAGRAKKAQPKPRASTPSPTALIDDLGLTERAKRFALFFHQTGNASESARRAGYSLKSAESEGVRQQKNAKVAEALRRLAAAAYERLGDDADRLRLELRRIAYAKIDDVGTWERGKLRLQDSSDIAPEDMAAIAEVGYDSKGHLRVKMFDKLRAIDLYAKVLKLYRDDEEAQRPPAPDLNVNVNVGVEARVQRVDELSDEERAAIADAIVARRARRAGPGQAPDPGRGEAG